MPQSGTGFLFLCSVNHYYTQTQNTMSIKEILQDYALQELEKQIIMVFEGPFSKDYNYIDERSLLRVRRDIINHYVLQHQKELLPDIKKMFETGLVDIGACGDYAEVSRLIDDPREAGSTEKCILDIHERFTDMKRTWER